VGIDPEKQVKHVELISSMSCFEIASFEEIAAIECAKLPSLQELRQLSPDKTANKIKFDRQIIAIAKSLNISEVWSHDLQVFGKCKEMGITTKSLADILPNPEQFPLYPDHDNYATH
ncbi:VapC toxin family PIN domain ribonuclease, partial [Xenorhabdus bovienii]